MTHAGNGKSFTESEKYGETRFGGDLLMKTEVGLYRMHFRTYYSVVDLCSTVMYADVCVFRLFMSCGMS